MAAKEVVLNETTILQEILSYSDSNSSNDESDVEIKKISYSVVLKQCKSLIQYVEQQEPVKFVKDQDLPQLRSLLK
ncbi:10527_t:CDS:2 [Dentiscutata erythropus]|uniref:10527_t:CDS:1 n=1 Tax=Dentiscutata erythropus TaxID=1348616 RepID=A0A9N9ELT2_9GLOM|nr:10527_t:CDS:2 [Dentiscutata erythropus]